MVRGLVFVVLVVAAGCGAPPAPSAATEALEAALLTVDDIGGGFEEDFRGAVGVSGGRICPASDFRSPDTGMVRATFTRALGAEARIEIEQMMYVVEAGGIDRAIADLEAAYEACDGLVWTDYGEEKTVEMLAAPDIGDRSFAVAFPPPGSRGDGTYEYGRSVWAASGNVLIEIRCWETLTTDGAAAVMSDEDLYRIVEQAVANLASSNLSS
jgi:hypothetical protein